MLVRQGDRPRLSAFVGSYAQTWATDGWGSRDLEYLTNLPYRDVTGRRSTEWRVKARSMETLFHVLPPQTWKRVVDLGCGAGWLSHHLARHGHEVFAVDINLDETVGLAAAGAYNRIGPPFERVWGDSHHPPFLTSTIDAVVCNASLHLSSDVTAVLTEISRILRSGGVLLVMNSPVHETADSAARAQFDFRKHLSNLGATGDVVAIYHHLVRSELESYMRTSVGPVHEIPFDPGRLFRWSRRIKGIALRMELASFPILMATKP